MRGATKHRVALLFAMSGIASSALLGWASGVVWQAARGAPLGATTVLAIVVAAAGADLASHRWSAMRPPSLGRPVPQTWGRLFGPGTAATLYGARLGMGPLTLLPTWLWWAAAVIAASAGPWWAAAAGAIFAASRSAVTVAVTAGTGPGPTAAHRMEALRRRQGSAAVLLALASVVAVGAISGWAGVGADETTGPTTQPDPSPTALDRASIETIPATTTPEDTMRTATLAGLLPDETLPGFHRADAVLGAGPLDLEAAAHSEIDVEAERAVLLTRGFVGGLARSWMNDRGDVVYLVIYEFGDAAGAAAYLADGAQTLVGKAARPFDVPEIPGSLGVTQIDETPAGAFTAHAVAFTRGAHYALVVVGGSGSGRTTDEARALATDLDARLTGS